MLFMFICSVFIVLAVILLRKAGVSYPFSKGLAIAAGLSVLAAVCLTQNFTQSLIPGANDGIGISNRIAYWIIGETLWTTEIFKDYYERSVLIAFFVIAAYPLALAIEAKRQAKSRQPHGSSASS